VTSLSLFLCNKFITDTVKNCNYVPPPFLTAILLHSRRRYFDSPGDFESRINGSIEMETLEDQLRESCGPYMQRFFALLDGAVTYHEELCGYLNDLQVRIVCFL
jgi:hypothetical protein